MASRPGSGVARHSLHMQGQAMDVRLHGCSCSNLRDLALTAAGAESVTIAARTSCTSIPAASAAGTANYFTGRTAAATSRRNQRFTAASPNCAPGATTRCWARCASGWAVFGRQQFVRGYLLLLPDPVVPALNALSGEQRAQFLLDMSSSGDALMRTLAPLRIKLRHLRQCRAGTARARDSTVFR